MFLEIEKFISGPCCIDRMLEAVPFPQLANLELQLVKSSGQLLCDFRSLVAYRFKAFPLSFNFFHLNYDSWGEMIGATWT